MTQCVKQWILSVMTGIFWKQTSGHLTTFRCLLNSWSQMSHDIAAVGKLRERLEAYFNGDEFIRKKKAIQEFRSDTSVGSTSTGTRSAEFRQEIHDDINASSPKPRRWQCLWSIGTRRRLQVKRIAAQTKQPLSQVGQNALLNNVKLTSW